jgi:circadian clock protein KaiB
MWGRPNMAMGEQISVGERVRKKWSPMKKAGRRERGKDAKAGGETYLFRLFVAGNESNSAQARGNLTRLCAMHIKGHHKIDTVDVLKDAASAQENNVLVTPTLILIKPLPKVIILGNLSDTQQVLGALRLIGDRQ